MIFNNLQTFNDILTLMIIVFNKYQVTGNDFIITDNRNGVINPEESNLINKLCNRRFGIGADGLILISGSHNYDFEMKYFNSDGFESTMCDNDTCITASSIASVLSGQFDTIPVNVKTKGGNWQFHSRLLQNQ